MFSVGRPDRALCGCEIGNDLARLSSGDRRNPNGTATRNRSRDASRAHPISDVLAIRRELGIPAVSYQFADIAPERRNLVNATAVAIGTEYDPAAIGRKVG